MGDDYSSDCELSGVVNQCPPVEVNCEMKVMKEIGPDLLTSATTKFQGKERLRQRSRVRDFSPNMEMCMLLAAWRLKWG